MFIKKSILLCCIFFLSSFQKGDDHVYAVKNGKIQFISDAPLELIEATSTEVKGLLDITRKTFAFSVPMRSFEGFNSPLQREHFNENYVESSKYPNASFSGKIIEDIDFSKEATHTVRAKGKLKIHGVEQERIIKGNLIVQSNKITITSDFTVLLQEHNITIPRIVYQKIAEEIKVHVDFELEKE